MISFRRTVDYHNEFTMFATLQIDFAILHQARITVLPIPIIKITVDHLQDVIKLG